MEISQWNNGTENQTKKELKAISETWDNTEHCKSTRIKIPEEDDKEKELENVFEEELWLKISQT